MYRLMYHVCVCVWVPASVHAKHKSKTKVQMCVCDKIHSSIILIILRHALVHVRGEHKFEISKSADINT